MLVFPNAKINIGLNIIEKRTDGYHNLETIFYPVSLSDILEFVVSENKTTFRNTGLKIDVEENENLVLKAYKLLKNKYKLPELNIHLHKIIPFGAGLGGGSSDAAFMLKSLNNFFKLNISIPKLESYAQQLGSDCPFFIKNKAVFAEGTGNIFSETELNLSEYFIKIESLGIHVNTKEAFSEIKPEKSGMQLNELIKLPVKEWKKYIKNDFEDVVFKKHPQIKKVKSEFYENGAVYSQMSGSGSAVFGIFEKKK